MEYKVGDKVLMKKAHPCGNAEFIIDDSEVTPDDNRGAIFVVPTTTTSYSIDTKPSYPAFFNIARHCFTGTSPSPTTAPPK